MESIKQRLFTNWHLMRIIRLVIGVWMLVTGIQTRDWVVGMFSAFFLYQAVTDTGCCGSQGCYVPGSAKKQTVTDDVDYEEVK